MLKLRTRLLAGLVSAAALTSTAQAQWMAFDPCNACAPPVAVCNPCMQAIPQTVYRDVPVTAYREVKRMEKRPIVRTVMEDRPTTIYRQVFEPQVREVQSVSYQTVTECQQQCVNRSHWQTVMQPVPKMAPCQYDSRPGLLGGLNRLSYSTRMAFTPNYVARREFVPNVQMVNVPVQRVVAVPTTRQVTYNVARLVPEQITQKVAVLKTEYVEQEVTAYEPYTTTQRMAVGTTFQYAFADPYGSVAPSATAAAPTPAEPRTAEGDKSPIKGLSYPKTESVPQRQEQPQPALEPQGKVASFTTPSGPVIRTVGWRPSRSAQPVVDSQPIAAPSF